MTPTPIHDTDLADRQQAKAALHQSLRIHGGDPAQSSVAAVIERLIAINPTPAPARATSQLEGDWRLISVPNFPGGEQLADGRYSYTLGRLAFNMFQPQNMKVVINQVSQPVWPIADSPHHSHDIVVDFTTLGLEEPLQGRVRNLGICQPATDNQLQVQFTGGVLEPVADTDRNHWRAVFGNPDATPPAGLKAWIQGLVLKLMFGLVPPGEMTADTDRVEFQMRRSPKGKLTILYLDEDLRITQGEKGTVLVCERQS
jgi:hypothetical protein